MKKYEYKHIRLAYGFKSMFSKSAFNNQLMPVLEKMGNDGWELKSSFHEGMEAHVHLIFGREKEN